MKLANVMAMTTVCVAMLGVGCVDESDGLDEVSEAQLDAELLLEDELDAMDLAPQFGGGIALGAEATVVGVETIDVTIPSSLHAQQLAVPAKLVRPKWSGAVGKKPAILVLHGSGGLMKMPTNSDHKPCSPEMESQFTIWSERLAKLGYTVLLPSSYSARGFCDKNKDTARIPKTFDTNTEQILGRLYDVDAASRYLCTRPEVDCERMGLLGFSQGATMVMIALHWQFEHAVAHFRATSASLVDYPIPDIKPGRPEFQVGVAYYPGCGFDKVVPLSLSQSAKIQDMFTPTAPLTILHAEKDSLLGHCSTKFGTGARQTQSQTVAAALKLSDLYKLTVYPKADHGFDAAKSTGADATAREAALKVTLSTLAANL